MASPDFARILREFNARRNAEQVAPAAAPSYSPLNRVIVQQITFLPEDISPKHWEEAADLRAELTNYPATFGSVQYVDDMLRFQWRCKFERLQLLTLDTRILVGRRGKNIAAPDRRTSLFQVGQAGVSSRHAYISLDACGLLWIVDAGSSNGTKILRLTDDRDEFYEQIDVSDVQAVPLGIGDYIFLGMVAEPSHGVLLRIDSVG